MTKKELHRKMSDVFWSVYWSDKRSLIGTGMTEYDKLCDEISDKVEAGELPKNVLRWVFEIDARLIDVAQC